jgi:hypothetical protein
MGPKEGSTPVQTGQLTVGSNINRTGTRVTVFSLEPERCVLQWFIVKLLELEAWGMRTVREPRRKGTCAVGILDASTSNGSEVNISAYVCDRIVKCSNMLYIKESNKSGFQSKPRLYWRHKLDNIIEFHQQGFRPNASPTDESISLSSDNEEMHENTVDVTLKLILKYSST